MTSDGTTTHPSATAVLQILDAGGYHAPSGAWVDLREDQARSEDGTELYDPARLSELRDRDHTRTAETSLSPLAVLDLTTQEASHSLLQDGPVALLNFASARNPGGGFLGGAQAQEEDLCRCSGLYRTLLQKPAYYEFHREYRSLLYSDRIIYSPRVPFFRISAGSALLEQPYFPSVITAPAPNAGALLQNTPEDASLVRPAFERRWAAVFEVARAHGHRTLVLGAWGCGAFRNDPAVVAEVASAVIHAPRFRGAFDRIVFAIPNKGKRGASNHAAFLRALQHAQ